MGDQESGSEEKISREQVEDGEAAKARQRCREAQRWMIADAVERADGRNGGDV